MTRPFAVLAVLAAAVPAAFAAAADLSPEQRQGVAQALELHGFTVQELAPQVGPDGSLRVELLLGDRAAMLLLQPHAIRAAGFALVEVGADGVSLALPAGPVTTYRGTIEDDPDSRVAAGFAGGRLTAWIDTGEALWMTQSVADALPEAAPGQTAVFAADEMDLSRWFCAVEDVAPAPGGGAWEGGVAPRGVSDCPTRLVTIEMTADRAFSILHGAFAQSRIEAMVNIVSAIYEDNLSTQIELIGIRTFASVDPWNIPDDGTGSVDSGDLLDAFTDYVGAAAPVAGGDRDFAHLASGREFAGSTVGLAWVGTTCSNAAAGVDQWNGINLPFNAGILAHELGHNWGAQHDGSGNACASSGFIMSPSICANCGALPDRFSTCSLASITPNLSRPCVTQLPPVLGAFGALNDAFAIPRGTPYLLDVRANDLVCVDGQRVQVGTLTLPSQTTAAGFPITVVPGAGPDGRDVVDYAPNPNFSGSDNFTYTLVDGAQSASAFVTISVSAGVAPPICECDCFSEYRQDTGPVGGVSFPPGVAVSWMNRFNVEPGANQIIQVTLFGGNAGSNTIRFVIWDDPNHDGQPYDAIPIATSPAVVLNAGGPTSYVFPPTDVGAPGESFFVGASYVSGQFLIDFATEDNLSDRSWLSVGPSLLIGQNFQTGPTDNRLVIRALGGSDLADCNTNGILDVCDVANHIRPDVDHNGVPDECDPPPAECPCEFDGDAGQVNVFDLLAYLDAWFPGAPAADIDGASGVNVFDLLAYLDCWFPASAGDPCE